MSGKDSAFPIFDEDGAAGADRGLTKRELFAAMAMQGVLSISPPGSTYRADDDWRDEAGWLARRSVMAADALLAALKEPSP